MRRPASGARQYKERSKECGGNATETVERGTVKISIRKQLPFAPHDLLNPLRNSIEFLFLTLPRQALSPGLDNIRTRVGNAVDAMSKTHDYLFSGQQIKHTLLGLLRGLKLFDQGHGCLIGSA